MTKAKVRVWNTDGTGNIQLVIMVQDGSGPTRQASQVNYASYDDIQESFETDLDNAAPDTIHGA